MAPDARKNFATSLVAVAPIPAASGVALTVTTGEGTRFPATPFNAVVCPASAIPTPANAEVVRVTAVVTDVLTITRTQESSSARTIIAGDRIYAGATALSMRQYVPGIQQGYVSTQYYPAYMGSTVLAGAGVPTLNRTHFAPFVVEIPTTFDRIASMITVNGTATCVDRMGLYLDDGNSGGPGKPGTLLLDAGTVATDSGAAIIKSIVISQLLQPGLYWSAICGQVATAATHQRITPQAAGAHLNAAFTNTLFYTDQYTSVFASNPTVAVSGTIAPPAIGLRAA